MQDQLTKQEEKLINIISEHIRLAAEFASLPINGGNTPEEADVISKRKSEIKSRIAELRLQRKAIEYN
jgi:hypothetical protein